MKHTAPMIKKRISTPPSLSAAIITVGAGLGRRVGAGLGSDVGAGLGGGVGAGLGSGFGARLGGSVGAALGSSVVGTGVGSGVGVRVGTNVGVRVGTGDGDVDGCSDGAGDGGVDGSGDGAGVGENVATSTESACALAIDSRRAARSPGALVPARRRRAAADWIAVVKLPSLTAASSVAITCEYTLWSPLLSAYVLAMNASGMRTSLVRVTPVVPSAYSAHVASSNVEFERTASHASS